MKLLSAALGLAALAVVHADTYLWNFRNCGGATDMNIVQASVQPFPFCPTDTYSIVLSGTTNVDIKTGAKITVTARVNGQVVYTDTDSYCRPAGSVDGVPCPTRAGSSDMFITFLKKKAGLPLEVAAEYTFQATNANGRVLFCQKADLFPGKCPN
ncbi:hypothetical protein CPB97_008876 [Podila verticillata]|nr:hypothetical protein CPB97_008876 [Podila verticillata]